MGPSNVTESEVDDFEQALLATDQATAARQLLQSYRQNGPVVAFNDLVIPALVRIGSGWEEGEVALAQVYMSGKLSQQLIADLPTPATDARADQPSLAIGILEDSHVLGKQIVVQMLQGRIQSECSAQRLQFTSLMHGKKWRRSEAAGSSHVHPEGRQGNGTLQTLHLPPQSRETAGIRQAIGLPRHVMLLHAIA